jgi:hypothetical protein
MKYSYAFILIIRDFCEFVRKSLRILYSFVLGTAGDNQTSNVHVCKKPKLVPEK